MDSSPVLQQQSSNRTLLDNSRLNRMAANPKPGSKHPSVPFVPAGHLSKRGSENQDPAAVSDKGQNPPATHRPLCISRLPVLAKFLQLQTPSDFNVTHKTWEANSLTGKAKRKKPTTKPVPFNFSTIRTNRIGAHNQRNEMRTPLARAQPTQADSPFHTASFSNTRPATKTAKPPVTVRQAHNKAQSKSTGELAAQPPTLAKHLATNKAGLTGILSQHSGEAGKTTTVATSVSWSQHTKPKAQASKDTPMYNSASVNLGSPRPSSPLCSSAGPSSNVFSFSTASSTASTQPRALTTEACRGHFNNLSLKDLSRPALLPRPVEADFSSDPAALHSILQNEGVTAARACVASRASTQSCNHKPQRVSVMKSVQNTSFSTGPTRSVQFSPQPSSTNSILQNEGVSSSLQHLRVSVMKGQLKTAPPADPLRSVKFSPDSAALKSILRNEGVKPGGTQNGRGTSIYSAQRVPVTKNRATSPGGTTNPLRSVKFSPDSAALKSILRNEGVKPGGTLGSTPQNGRGTSIYSAQRVPVTKNRSSSPEQTSRRIPATKWTPQRVPNTQSTSMRMLQSSYHTPYTYSSRRRPLQAHGRDIETHTEEVVQRLFKEEEEEKTAELALGQELAETRADQQDGDRNTGLRPPTFFPAPHRESVIFFSTGQKLLRAAPEPVSPVARPLERPWPLDQGLAEARAAAQPEAMNILSGQPELVRSSETMVPEVTHAATCLPKLSAFVPLSQHTAISSAGGLIKAKTGSLNFAAALLRLDEEVANYTCSAATPCPSVPLRTRCGNPVASALCLQEITSFRPIILDPSSSSSSPCSSPLRDR